MIKTPNVTIVNTSVDPGLNYLTNQDLTNIRNSNNITTTPTDTSLIVNKLEDVIKVINLVTVIDKNAVLSPGGSNSQIQLNLNGRLSGDAGLTYDAVDDKLTTGNLVVTTKVILPEIRNVSILGGTYGQLLTTTGDGNLFWGNIESSQQSATWASILNKPSFANVATSGSYTDLIDTPTIPSITGLASTTYVDNEIANLATVTWANVSSKPLFANVSTSGSYTDLIDTPTIPSINGLASTLYVDNRVREIPWANIIGAPTIPTVSETGQTVIAPGLDSGIDLGEGSKIQSFSGLRILNNTGQDISIITTDVNGDHEWLFDQSGKLSLPLGGDILNSDGQSVLGGGSGASTGNITFADNTLTGTGDVKIHFTPSASPAVEFNFASNGTLTLPSTLNVAGGDAPSITGLDGVKISATEGKQLMLDWQAAAVNPYPGLPQLSTTVALVNLDYNGVSIEVNNADGGGYWTFGPTGKLKLPPGGDIVDSAGASVLGGATYDQSLNTTNSVTFNQVSATEILQNSSRTKSTTTVNVPGAIPTVVYSAPSSYTSIKLVIAVEGRLDGDTTNVDHTQTCEATIAATYNTTAEPIISVYGIVYTSPAPLATFTVARNTVAGTIEVTAINSQTTNALGVRVHAIQFVSRYD